MPDAFASHSSPVASITIAFGTITLIYDAVGIAQWPQTSTAWLTIVAGGVAMLFGIPAIWRVRRRGEAGWRTEAFFAAAVMLSVLGAAFVGGGLVALGTGTAPDASAAGGGRSGGPHGNAGAPSTAGGTASDRGPSVQPPMRHQGPVTLTVGYQIDLDSTDPGWGVVRPSASDEHPETDVSLALGSFSEVHKGQLASSDAVSY